VTWNPFSGRIITQRLDDSSRSLDEPNLDGGAGVSRRIAQRFELGCAGDKPARRRIRLDTSSLASPPREAAGFKLTHSIVCFLEFAPMRLGARRMGCDRTDTGPLSVRLLWGRAPAMNWYLFLGHCRIQRPRRGGGRPINIIASQRTRTSLARVPPTSLGPCRRAPAITNPDTAGWLFRRPSVAGGHACRPRSATAECPIMPLGWRRAIAFPTTGYRYEVGMIPPLPDGHCARHSRTPPRPAIFPSWPLALGVVGAQPVLATPVAQGHHSKPSSAAAPTNTDAP